MMIQSDMLEMIEILNDGGFTVMAAATIVEDIYIHATLFDVYARFYSCKYCWASKCRCL
jgi:hypothetical protein